MYHYGAALAPILLFTSLWSAAQLKKLQKIGLILLVAGTSTTLLTLTYTTLFTQQKAPILMFFNPAFYQVTNNNSFLWELVQNTPSTGSVMAQNHLGLPVSNREWTYMLAQNYEELVEKDPDYLVFDIREGQNPNNYFPAGEEKWLSIVEQALDERRYTPRYQKDTLYILEKTTTTSDAGSETQ